MRLKLLAITALAASVMVACTSDPKVADKATAPKAEPALLTGASAEVLARNCDGCHGTNGNSSGPAIPTIAGMSVDYLSESMEAYRDGDTQSTIMGRIMKGYTEEEIDKIAEYFAAKKFQPAAQAHNAGQVKRGKMLHDKYCEKCHADGGSNVEDDSGLLAGQWIPYLEYTMQDYAEGDRDMVKKMQKKLDAMIAKEGNSGVEALIQYYGSQK
ncbi:MAG: cytochrome c4 [Gammaproteobacteria bacterium]|nr:MAG: cytochrome c4 [Gammaproteobacteria bacterium]